MTAEQIRENSTTVLKTIRESATANQGHVSSDAIQCGIFAAAMEIAAQLAEMNERTRADQVTMDKEFSDIATKVKKWRGTSE